MAQAGSWCEIRVGFSGEKVARTLRVWHGPTENALEPGTAPHFRGVRVVLCTGYHRVRGIGRVWRNSGVSSSPPPDSPQLHRTVSANITYGKMLTWFVTSPPTDNSPQPKEALPTVPQLSPFKLFDSAAL
jgi:hypothetical protein